MISQILAAKSLFTS